MVMAGAGDLVRSAVTTPLPAVLRGEWRKVALVSALILGLVVFRLVIYLRNRKARPATEDHWVVPSAEEVVRVVKSEPGGPAGDRSDPA